MNIKQKLESLLALSGENEIVEFKEAKNNYSFDKLGKYFSALCNEASLKGVTSAWLIFGVNNHRQVVGTNYRRERQALESLKTEIADKTTNRISFIEIHEVGHQQGRVILFEIPAAPKGLPVAFEGHYYGRDGESLSPLNLEEIERIRTQALVNDWSAQICFSATLADLCPDALYRARELYAVKHPKLRDEINQWDDGTFLNKAKLTIDGKITRAALLLLGRAESDYFLSPANAHITWILKDRDGVEKDYEHFGCPYLLAVEKVFHKIRNLKYRYMVDGTLFPEEVDQYDPYIIREALNNCIAHQDYSLGSKITVVEFEDGRLCFSNAGSFIPVTVNQVIKSDAPASRYRNSLLANAMVNMNLIDTIGSGIRKMFLIQRKKYFPLPEYDLNANHVQVTIIGKVLDINYARKLVQAPDLKLEEIILLDKVQKRSSITDDEAKHLKQQKLIEGRKPNYHISAYLAGYVDDKAQYIKTKGLDDEFYKQIICDYLHKFGTAKRVDLEKFLLDKLPEILNEKQKSNKVKNLLQTLRLQGLIDVNGKLWKMSKG